MGKLSVGVFQAMAHDHDAEDSFAALDRAINQVKIQQKQTFDLIVCPELFTSGYFIEAALEHRSEPANGPSFQRAQALARNHQTALCYGFPETTPLGRYNSAMVVDRQGQRLALHRKVHLSGPYEKSNFILGEQTTLFDLAGWKIALMICYDVEMCEMARTAAKDGAQLLIAPTALNTQWEVVANCVIPTRGFENGIFVAYANLAGSENGLDYAGLSCLVGPAGDFRARAGRDEELIGVEIDSADVAALQTRLPYLQDLRPQLYR